MAKVLIGFILLLTFSHSSYAETLGDIYTAIEYYPLVIGGEKSTKDNYHSNQLVKLTSSRGLCSGTIISNNAILTAAHCRGSFGRISFGVDGDEHRKVSDYSIFPDYIDIDGDKFKFDRSTYDIAIVFFDGGLPDGFLPMSLPPRNKSLLYSGKSIYMAGYGENRRQRVGVLKYFRTKVTDPKMYDGSEFISDNVSAGSVCYGDSGGPGFVVHNGINTIVGISSHFGSDYKDKKRCQSEQIYSASVSFYLDWIEDEVNQYSARTFVE